MSEQQTVYDELSPLGKAALHLAQKHGWWVFPLEPRGKKPLGALVPHGLLEATTDAGKIAEWWHKQPKANIGIACGPSGLVIIDVDPRHGGDESIRDLMRLYPELNDTVTGETGGGGWHLAYSAPFIPIHNSTGQLAPGLDVRGTGGYIVAPPSVHPDGGTYEWMVELSPDDRQPASLPLPIVEALTTPQDGADAPVDVEAVLGGVGEGERDWKLFQLAAKLRYADVPIDWAYRLVGEAAANCVPPFPQVDARKKVESAYRYPAGKVAIAAPADMEQTEIDTSGRYLLGRAILDGIPEPEWLVDKLLIRGLVCLMYGKPGCGKTLFMTGIAHDLIREKHHVLFIDEENGPALIGSRFDMLGADPSLLDEYMHYFPFTGFSLEDMPKLDAYVSQVRPSLVIMDSFGALLSASRLEENSNDDILRWMTAIPGYLSRKYNCAVVIIDHITKEGKTEYSVGGGAKKRAADYQWCVTQVTKFDSETMGQVKLTEEKNRLGQLPASHTYDMGGAGGRIIVRRYDPMNGSPVRSLTPTQTAVLKAFEGDKYDEGLYVDEIQNKAGRTERSVRTALKELISRGLVEAEQDQTARNKLTYFAVRKGNSATLQRYENDEFAPMKMQPPRKGVAEVQGEISGVTLQMEESDGDTIAEWEP